MKLFKQPSAPLPKTRIAVVGTGMVGSSFAYAAMIKGLAAEIVMVDADEQREAGEVMDLTHGLIGTETGNIVGGDFKECQKVDIIVLTAGAPQKPGETRLDLVKKNALILKSIIKKMGPLRRDTVVIVVANPVDILTTLARKWMNLPPHQIFGSGTSLDTSRLRYNVSQLLNINLHNIHAYVLGEHGDSEFAAWSMSMASGAPLTKLLTKTQMKNLEDKTRRAAYEIIQRKRATYYGIGVVITELVEAVLNDKKMIIPVSTEPGNAYGIKGICLGVPAVLGRGGAEKVWPLALNALETKKLKQSAALLKGYLKSI
ncbi:L-lactate dehydrogenase [Candidatus Peregrinibacteria bacterium]|nr:MAG: L-lactate dehydrogenase [Candidatus Peregrinibacteria bacterium]